MLSVLSSNSTTQEGIDLAFEEFSQGQFNHAKDELDLGLDTAHIELEDEDTTNSTSVTQGSTRVGQLDILT